MKQDLYKTIQGQDYKSVSVDQDESGVYLIVHHPGAYAGLALSRDAAIELLGAIQSILGVNHE